MVMEIVDNYVSLLKLREELEKDYKVSSITLKGDGSYAIYVYYRKEGREDVRERGV